jgi:hypothetical protein
MQHQTLAIVLAGAVTLTVGSRPALAERPTAGSWWEGFAGVGLRASADIRIRSGPRALGSSADGDAVVDGLLARAGALDANVDRLYDDGFVCQGDPGLGLTTNWRYSSAGQVRASSQDWDNDETTVDESIYFTSSGPVDVGGQEFSDTMGMDVAPMLELRRMWARGQADIGLALGWTMLGADSKDTRSSEVSGVGFSLVDEYFLYGIVPPAAPYTGPLLPPGPLLDNAPTDRVVTEGTGTSTATLRTRGEADVQTVSFGAVWRSGRRESREAGKPHLDVQGGLTGNFVNLKYSQTVTTVNGATVSSVDDSFTNRTIRLGYYASADAVLPLNESVSLVLRARYDFLPEMSVGNSNSSAKVELSGASVWLGCSKRW